MLHGTMLHADNSKRGVGLSRTQASSRAIYAWVFFTMIVFGVYHEVAEKHFTFTLTFSGFAQTLSFMFLLMQINGSVSVTGISAKTLMLHAVKICCRLSSTLWLNGYLPVDQSGDWIYQASDLLSLMLVIMLLFSVLVFFKHTYQADEDTLDAQKLMLGAFILAVFIHPNQNNWAAFDILWTTHLYIDAVAMVPQLWMVSKAGGQVKGMTAHYMAATLLSYLFSFYFWFTANSELATETHAIRYNIIGLTVNAAHVVQVLLLLDFGYYYSKACLKGNLRSSDIFLGDGSLDL